jgi:hypothetical protein
MADSIIDIKEPRTTREMFQFIMRDVNDLKNGMADFNSAQMQHDKRLVEVESCVKVQQEAVSTLKKKVEGWNVINSLGVIIAAILAALGLKSS